MRNFYVTSKRQRDVFASFCTVKKISLFALSILFSANLFAQTTTYSTPGTYTFTVPVGVFSINVSTWGAGGAGGGTNAAFPRGGGGGEGGSFVRGTMAVIPGATYTVVVGDGGNISTGAGTAGGASSFSVSGGGATLYNAIGGAGGGAGTTGTGLNFGAGGNTPNTGNIVTGTSQITFYGGNGATATSASTASSGGGGGSAGAGGNGGNGGILAGGTAGAAGVPADPGIVGANGRGSTNDGVGLTGGAPGAGGGGARSANSGNPAFNGGAGGNGQVKITYTAQTYKATISTFNGGGSANWCAGETRNVSVLVTNTGTATWTDGTGGYPNIRVGVKWNTNGANWTDYHVRVGAGNLAPGASATITLPITASNNAGAGYTTTLAAGTNNLIFDVVYEGVSWFGDNAGGVGPGNVKFTSAAQTIIAAPATPGGSTTQSFCGASSPTVANLVATGTTIKWYAAASGGTALATSTPLVDGTHYFATQTNGSGCESATRLDVTVVLATAITSLTYSSNPAVYCPNAAIIANTPTVGGGVAASYSVSPALPNGLTLNTTTGVISGIPTTATAAADYTVTATNACGTFPVNVNITISPAAPAALSYTALTPTYCVGTAITNNTPSNTGGAATSYSVTPVLPSGLSLDLSTGVISGTPLGAAAAANYTVTATNSCGSTPRAINITVTTAPLSISYSSSTVVYCPNTAITANTVTFTGGAPTNYIVSPALPAGLSINASTGAITGTPTTPTAAANYTITGSNTCGSQQAVVNITISPAAPTVLNYTNNSPVYCLNQAITNNTPSNTGGAATSYGISPALPAGLSLDVNTGIISGTPTVLAAGANYTVTATNSCGFTTRTVNITVTTVASLSYSTPAATYCAGVAITNNTATNSGGASTSYAVTPALPAGLTLNTTNGTISGNPTGASAATNYTITATNSCGVSAGTVVNITVNAQTITLTSANNTQTVCQNAPIGNITYNVGGSTTGAGVTGLPAGVTGSFAAGVFTITGTPTAVPNTYSYTVTTTGTCSAVTATGSITINALPVLTSVTATPATICAGSISTLNAQYETTLTAATGSQTNTTSASVTTSALGPNPFQTAYGGSKQQMLMRASELTALGMGTGSIISAMQVQMFAGDATVLENFTVRMQNTATNALTTTQTTAGFTTVYTSAGFTAGTGFVNIPFANDFTWDGTNNLLIEIYYTNNDNGGAATSRAYYSNIGFVGTNLYRADNRTAAQVLGNTTANFTYSQRNNLKFTFSAPYTITWSPLTDLYTNPAATTAYTGTNLETVYAKPAGTTTYTATATNALGCPKGTNVTVTVNPLPVPTISGPAVACLNIANTYSYSTEAGKTAYTWVVNGGTITAGGTTNTVTVTWTTAGSRNITVNYTQAGCTAPSPTSYAVTVNGSTPAFSAGATSICQNSSATYTVQSGMSNYVWNVTGGTITAGGNSTSNTATVLWTTAGNQSISINYTDNGCSAPAATVRTVTVAPITTANAGTPITMCSNTPAVITTGATASNYSSILWTTAGDGEFDDATLLTGAQYAPGPNDIAAGTVTITLTAIGISPCSNATSSKVITIRPAATAVAGTPINTCAGGGPVNITAGSSATNNTTVLWTSSGTGTFTNANSLTLATYNPSPADVTAGGVILQLTVGGTSPCGSATSSKIFSITSAPTSVAITPNISTICLGSSQVLTASAITSSSIPVLNAADNFNGTPSYITTGTGGGFLGVGAVWTKRNSGFNSFAIATFNTPDGTPFMLTTAAALILQTTTSELTSPVINTTNYQTLTLTYQHTYKQANAGASAQVQVSTNGGGSWTTIQNLTANAGGSSNFVNVTIPAATMAPYINQANLKIRFAYNSTVFFGGTSWWAIDNVQLNGTQIPLYSWTANTAAGVNGLPAGAGTPSASNATITVTPTATTVYTVTASDQVGTCTNSTATATVNVNQVATASISGATTICRGSTTNITFNATPNTTVTYTINGGANQTIAVGASGTATLTTAALTVNTTYALVSVGYTAAPACTQAVTGSVLVTVNQIATASISGTTTICLGGSTTINFTATPNTTVTYTINGGTNQTIAVGPSGTASINTGALAANTTYALVNVAYTAAPACTQTVTGSAVVTVRPNATVVISGNTAICSGGSATITFTGTPNTTVSYNINGAGSFTIAIGAGGTATVSTGVITATTVYNLTGIAYTAAPGCAQTATGSATVTINAAATASISGTTTICAGSSASITFTATPNTTVGYQVNGAGPVLTIAVDGTGTAILVAGPLAATTTYNLVNVGYTATPACTQTATGVVTINVNPTGTWLGITSNWHNAGNWCGGSIPTNVTSVSIPVMAPGFFYPVISTPATANNITTAAGATITINNTNLDVYGSITSTNGIDATDGHITFKGGSLQTVSGSMFVSKQIRDITIDNNVNVTGGDSLKISGTLDFGSPTGGRTFAAGTNNVVLLSSFNRTANVPNIGNNNITGSKFTVERYINTAGAATPGNPLSHGRTWQLLSVPTNSTQTVNNAWQEAQGANANSLPGYGTLLNGPSAQGGYDNNSAGTYIKYYLPNVDQWSLGSNPTTTQIATNRGWMTFVIGDRSSTPTVAKPTILRTTGSLFTGTQPAINITANKYDVVGNPYPSEIDLRELIQPGSNLTEDVYVWDPSLGAGFGFGRYVTLTKIGNDYEAVPPSAMYPGIVNTIQSGQAFFVKSNGVATSSVTFTEAVKTNSNRVVTRGTNGANETMRINLSIGAAGATKTLLDGAIAVFDDQYVPGVDRFDGLKLINSGENAGFKTAGKALAVDRRPSPLAADTLYVEMTAMKIQPYSWEVIASNMSRPGRNAWLLDNFLGTRTPLALEGSTIVNFDVTSAAASAASNRFSIIFNKITAPLPVTITSISATRNNDRSIAVKWSVENELNIDRYEVERSADGVQFTGILTAASTNSRNYAKDDLSPLSKDNFYRIKATSIGGQVQYSAIVKVAPVKTVSSISVYPNPVEGKIVNLRFTDMAAGVYQLQLSNSLGQIVYSGTATVNAINFVKNITLSKLVTAGNYQLRVVDADGHAKDIQLIIQ